MHIRCDIVCFRRIDYADPLFFGLFLLHNYTSAVLILLSSCGDPDFCFALMAVQLSSHRLFGLSSTNRTVFPMALTVDSSAYTYHALNVSQYFGPNA